MDTDVIISLIVILMAAVTMTFLPGLSRRQIKNAKMKSDQENTIY